MKNTSTDRLPPLWTSLLNKTKRPLCSKFHSHLMRDNSRYLCVLRETPSRGQCFQLCPARWFQPCCPSTPSASSYCLLERSHLISNQTHCDFRVQGKVSHLVWLLRGLDCQWTQTSPPLKQKTWYLVTWTKIAGHKKSWSTHPTHHSYLESILSVLCKSPSTSCRHSEQKVRELLCFCLM